MNFKEWLLLTEAKKTKDLALEILGNDQNLLNQIRSIIPTNIKQDLQAKLLPLAAYYYKQKKDLNTLKQDLQDYSVLVKDNKMPLIRVDDKGNVDNQFKNYIDWTQVIHGKKYEQERKTKESGSLIRGNVESQNKIATSKDGLITVYKANSVNQCIMLGKGQTFCISRPGNTMWQSYRDTKGSSFYFVYDKSRTDNLSTVVVDSNYNGIELTDVSNNTGRIQNPFNPDKQDLDHSNYFKYLQSKGIDTSIFKNIPKTEEEEAEQSIIGKSNKNLEWFKTLSPDLKSKYIGRGYSLTDEQFDYLWNNKFIPLLEQYVKTGKRLPEYQFEKIISNKDLESNYVHNRIIANQQINDIEKYEFEKFSEENKKKLLNSYPNLSSKFDFLVKIGDYQNANNLLDDLNTIKSPTFERITSAGNIDLAKKILDKELLYPDPEGHFAADAVYSAITNGQFKMVDFLLNNRKFQFDHNNELALRHMLRLAVMYNRLDITKYLIEKYKIQVYPFLKVSKSKEMDSLLNKIDDMQQKEYFSNPSNRPPEI